MSKATFAILDHYSSTPENPMHDNCPLGAESFCSYNRDKATGLKTHVPTANPFTTELRDVLLPVFTKLGSRDFLDKCKNTRTQNANESLHHVIWSLAPKDQ